jgi:arsenite methyltransferase
MTSRRKLLDEHDDQAVKSCCANVYQSEWARLLLGESFHPGGTALTAHLGAALRLLPGQRVLDVAAGQGTSAIHLAQRFGCSVLGIEYSPVAVERATRAAQEAGVAHLVAFEQGDAEQLPVPAASCDVVVCECAFCTFPNKALAASEFARVLSPGGRVGLSDLTRRGEIPAELQGLLAWIACLADAQPLETYVRSLTDAGLTVRLTTAVAAIERQGDHLLVHARTGGQEYTVEADLVVHAAGRVPEIDDLDLEVAGVAHEKEGVLVNEYLQSVSNPAVYAAGDAVKSGGFPLTPVAGMQGDIVARNLLEGNRRTPNYTGIPSVVFTTPPLARVGLLEEAARAQGLRFTTHHGDTSGWYSSRRVALLHTGFKVLVEEGSERLLGAHLLGLHAEEVINLFALAIRAGLRASDLKHMVYAYPTSASDIGYMV